MKSHNCFIQKTKFVFRPVVFNLVRRNSPRQDEGLGVWDLKNTFLQIQRMKWRGTVARKICSRLKTDGVSLLPEQNNFENTLFPDVLEEHHLGQEWDNRCFLMLAYQERDAELQQLMLPCAMLNCQVQGQRQMCPKLRRRGSGPVFCPPWQQWLIGLVS